MARALVLSALLVTLSLLAGCVDDTPDELPVDTPPEECAAAGACAPPVLDATGRDLRLGLTKEDTLEAPKWTIGDVFEQHIFYGNRDDAGEHIFTMVVDDGGDCYQMGTTSKTAAATDASFDLPVLGCIGKTSLQTSSFGANWDWMYSFPLSDGKSWPGAIDFMVNWNTNTLHSFAFTLTSTYQERINTPKGDFPGFMIQGVLEDGTVFLDYNYVPAVGWFSHFWMYDVTNDVPDGSDDIIFHAMSMGTSKGYTGPYFLDTGEDVIETFFHSLMVLSVADGEVPPQPEVSFTVPDTATYLHGVIVPVACPGIAKIVLVTPENTHEEYDHQYSGDAAACAESDESTPGIFTVHYIDRAAIAGDWRFTLAGAGVIGYFVWMNAVTEGAYTLEAPATA